MPARTPNKPAAARRAARDGREAALACLLEVTEGKKTLDAAFAALRSDHALEPRERALCEHLVRLTLKRRAWLEASLLRFLTRPLDKLPSKAYWLLLIGAAQCHYMEIPAYAAVNTTVDLAKRHKLQPLAGMMNAVLKKVAASDAPVLLGAQALASLPDWLSEALCADYGQERAAQIALASMADAEMLDLTPRNNEAASLPMLMQQHGAQWVSPVSVRIRTPESATEQLSGYEAGEWWVQDAAAALPVYGIRHLLNGARVLDVGAAPGGKTMQLAAYGADVVALDRSARRMTRLKENLARTGLSAAVVVADVLEWNGAERFDLVVLDAPCSATGTLRRHPDIAYQRTQADLAELVALQRRMLEAALRHVRAGGHLLYVTCSLLKEEGEAQIDWALSRFPSLTRAAFEGIEPCWLDALGQYRTTPEMRSDVGGMDGFFAALLRVG